ncbi:hypothetical protein [Salipiger aestuarii]|uniref:hypothetical protein n=1 Tax=Salipiger aestuarii TaxID=568098 RepID=UPI00123C5413|nr:hypothetical protein [Salipiger aestuarii]
MSLPAPSYADRPARPLVLLSCPAEAPEALCRSLTQALTRAATGQIVRQAPVDAPALRPGDTAVTLDVTRHGPAALSGRLDWQGTDGGGDGAVLRLDVMDAGLEAIDYDDFTRDLLRVWPALVARLHAAAP